MKPNRISMFSKLFSRSKRPATRRRTRRSQPETLETRRVLAASMNVCLAVPNVDLAHVPAHEWSPSKTEFGKNAEGVVVKPFRINGGGPAPDGLPLAPEVPGAHFASGIAKGLGKYDGAGEFYLDNIEVSKDGEVTVTFHGTFVFTAANGDKLATTYGGDVNDPTGILTGQGIFSDPEPGEDPVLLAVENANFDAFFAPDPVNSTGRFRNVVGGGWQMIAKSESISISNPQSGFTDSFNYTWSGTGTLEYAKKSTVPLKGAGSDALFYPMGVDANGDGDFDDKDDITPGYYAGFGKATHLGKTFIEGAVTEISSNPSEPGEFINADFSGVQTLRAANGDELYMEFSGSVVLEYVDGSEEKEAFGEWTAKGRITGGTGRFANATGEDILIVAVNPPFDVSQPAWPFDWSIDGEIDLGKKGKK